jgi:hypothetical protein
VYSGLPGSAFGGSFSGNGGSIPGRPGARGPGRVPVGSGPRRCSNDRLGGPPEPAGRGGNVLPVLGCCGRIGWPGRGPPAGRWPPWPSGRDAPCVVLGNGPRLPVGKGGRGGLAGRAGGAPGRACPAGDAAAERAAGGCGRSPAEDGVAGRTTLGPGWPAGAAGRIGVGGVALAGAAGFAA